MWDNFLKTDLPDFYKILKTHLDAAFQPIAESEGLTVMQARILIEIKSSEQATVGRVSRLMGENHGNCSSLCKKMEQAGFVRRIRSKADERIVILQLTPQGDQAVDTICRRIDERFQPALEATPPEQLADIRQGMQAMMEFLNKLTIIPDADPHTDRHADPSKKEQDHARE